MATGLVASGQSSGAAGGAASGSAAGAAGTSAVSPAGGAAGPGVAGGAAGAGAAGVSTRTGNLGTVGSAGINQPVVNAPIGGASALEARPNTIGGATVTSPSVGAPAGASALPSAGTIPSATAGAIGVNGQAVAGANAIGNAQAGIPITTLPANLQQSIQTRLGNGQVQTISRDDLANGSIFRVTTLQNGVPTEMRFAANGAFLGSTVLQGSATSTFTPGVAGSTLGAPGATVIPGGGVVLDTLPDPVQSTVRSQVGTGRINRIVPQGQGWVVTYDLNGRPTTLLVSADGRILRAGTTATGTAPAGSTGTARDQTDAASTNNNRRSSSIEVDDLPGGVRTSLQNELGAANVQFINREQRATGDVYAIGARTDDEYVQITFDAEGRIVRDSRATPVIAVGAAESARTKNNSNLPMARLPVAVRDAIKAYAADSDVRSVNLGLDQGRTVYDVVYMKSGRRDRLVISKDGSVVRTEQNVSPAYDNGGKAPRMAIGDLPPQVRETIRRQTDNVTVDEVSMREIGDQVLYAVRYKTNGAPIELLVDSDGSMVVPETSPDAQQANAARPAPIPYVEEEVIRTVPANEVTEATGAPARSETRAVVSTPTDENAEPEIQTVPLSDVPVAVQKSAKNLAGQRVIEAITPRLGDSGVVYEVTVSDGKDTQVLRLNKDGVVQQGGAK